MTIVDEARAILQRGISEIDAERERLQKALSELGGSGNGSARKPGRPKGQGKSKGGKGKGRRALVPSRTANAR